MLYYGLQVQLLTYLDAILSNDENSTFSKPAVLYLKIDDPIISIKKDLTDVKEIEAEILKELKMKGSLIKDIEILKGNGQKYGMAKNFL